MVPSVVIGHRSSHLEFPIINCTAPCAIPIFHALGVDTTPPPREARRGCSGGRRECPITLGESVSA